MRFLFTKVAGTRVESSIGNGLMAVQMWRTSVYSTVDIAVDNFVDRSSARDCPSAIHRPSPAVLRAPIMRRHLGGIAMFHVKRTEACDGVATEYGNTPPEDDFGPSFGA